MGRNELACLLACVDTAENEPLEVWGKFNSLFIRLLGRVGLRAAPRSAPARPGPCGRERPRPLEPALGALRGAGPGRTRRRALS